MRLRPAVPSADGSPGACRAASVTGRRCETVPTHERHAVRENDRGERAITIAKNRGEGRRQPEQRGCCSVADPAMNTWLPLLLPAGPKRKRRCGRPCPASRLVVREAVAQTMSGVDFLCVRDKVAIPNRIISVAVQPLWPAERLSRGRPK